MTTIDRALALAHLGLRGEDWGGQVGAETHAEFAEGWRGVAQCPTEAQIVEAYEGAMLSEAGTAVRVERDRRIQAVMWRYERLGRHFRLGLPMLDDMATLDAYVQALADIPDQQGFPHDVTWPTEP